MDYGYPMAEYKILYLKGVLENPNVCLCLDNISRETAWDMQFPLLEFRLQHWVVD